jgi:RNA-directed DNA polymerase
VNTDAPWPFAYLDDYTWHRVWRWLRRQHPRVHWKTLRRRYYQNWRPTENGVVLFDPRKVAVTRYRYRGANIPTLWPSANIGEVE